MTGTPRGATFKHAGYAGGKTIQSFDAAQLIDLKIETTELERAPRP
jgi:hypothetical protein